VLAVLSALAHGRDANSARAVEIAVAAQKAIVDLDDDRASIYVDLINNALGEAARQALKNMNMRRYEYQYQPSSRGTTTRGAELPALRSSSVDNLRRDSAVLSHM
jgi:hypothetical protein